MSTPPIVSGGRRPGVSGDGTPGARRRRRYLRLALVLLLVVLVLAAVAVLWGGRIRYPRSVARAAERVGDLDISRMGTVDELPDLHPVFSVAQRLDLSEEEAVMLKESAVDPSRVLTEDGRALIAAIGGRHRDLLAEAVRLMESSPRSLGFDNLTTDVAIIPGFRQQPMLARFLFLRALVALEDGDDLAVLETIRWLGWHAALHEMGLALEDHLVGFYSESFQLRLIARLLSTRRTAAELREMRGALSPHDVRALYRRALAFELARIRWIVQEIMEERSGQRSERFAEWFGALCGDALTYHMGAGAANWILDYDDAYELPFPDARARLDYDPDEIGFFEGVGVVIGVKAWWMPERYRGAAEVRQLIAILLEVLQAPGVRDCSDLADRLRPNAELVRVDGTVGDLCRVRYASAESYLATLDDNRGLDPPVSVLVATSEP